MYHNHFGFSLRDLTYVLHHQQHVLLVNLTGKIVYDGLWYKCNHVTDEEVIDLSVFESVNYHHCILITFKERNYVV